MSDDAIEADGLRKAFGQVTALDGLSLRVAAGSVLALLGPNGSGKNGNRGTYFRDPNGHLMEILTTAATGEPA
jgi:ABC-type branched-subunit amino acid transport system ATPase component